MENTLLLKAEVREQTGTKVAARLRKKGRIPAIIYGHKQEPAPISLDAHDFSQGLHHGHRLMNIDVNGKETAVIVKDLQYDYLGRDIIHVDMIRVDVTERIKISVPIELKGTAKGTHEGGIVEEHATCIDIECLVSSIPEVIIVNIKDVGVGDVLHASDITLPENTKLASPAETLLVTCHLKAAAVSEDDAVEEEETPGSPEVITEKKTDEAPE